MSPRPDWQLKPHGTSAAARRHRRRDQPLCEACKQAEALQSAEWRDRNPGYEPARQQAMKERYAAARAAGLSVPDAKRAKSSAARLDRMLAGVS